MTDVAMDGRSNGKGDASWAAKCWIIIVTGLNEETAEEDLQDLFGDYGEVKNLTMALNRRTGYVMADPQGYALIEYGTKEEAEAAIKGTTGTTFLEKELTTDFAFAKAPAGGRRGPPQGGRRGGRDRSLSPSRR